MKAAFWHERWQSNQLGFHQAEVNPHLASHWPTLGVDPAAAVFVPLCGKSLDMVWLHDRGHPVIGVELSPIACRDFFAEQALTAQPTAHGELERWSAPGYTIHCGDFFALSSADLDGVAGVFDRGSLVALPPEMRRRYADHMARILPPGAQVLLVTVDYDQSEMNGPPHSVPAREIEALYAERFEIERLAAHGPSEPPPHFQERGLRSMCEVIWRLARRGTRT
jgi:thiopurine S-methyltransferase